MAIQLDEKQAYGILSAFVALLVLTNGAQYMLNATGEVSKCSNGWVFQESGAHEGQWSCTTSTSTRYEYCASVRDSATGRKNYYCDLAIPQQVIEDKPIPAEIKKIYCSKDGCWQ